MLQEGWEEQDVGTLSATQYFLQLREQLINICLFARENLRKAQHTQERNKRGARLRTCHMAGHILQLLLSAESKLIAGWQGPFEVVQQMGHMDYEIRLPGRRKETKIYHVNLLKPWKTWEALLLIPSPTGPELGPQVPRSQEPTTVSRGEGLSPCKGSSFPN